MKIRTLIEIIIGILAVTSIVLVAVESLVSVSEGTLMAIYIADLFICLVFASDFLIRLRASDNRSHFMKTNGYEILAMFPAFGLYALGAIPTISTALRSLRLVRVIFLLARMRRAISKSPGFFRRSNLLAMMSITVSVIFIGAFSVMLLETGVEEAQITNFSDAIWWSVSTVTTVGYGDIVPESIAGRIMGMVLMVIGIGVMAAFISMVSAALVESRIKKTTEKDGFRTGVIAEIKNGIDRIDQMSDSEVAILMQMIKTLRVKGLSE